MTASIIDGKRSSGGPDMPPLEPAPGTYVREH